MKKSHFLKKTAVSLFVSSVFLSGFSFSASPSSTAILDFSSLENFSQPIDVSEQFNEKGVFGLGSGTLTFRVKPSGGFSTLLGVSDPNSNVRYIAFYVNSRNGNEQYGVELRTDNHTRLIPNSELVTPPIPSSDEFKTITYAFDKANQTIKIYVNGELKKATNQSKFFEDIDGLTSATVGSLKRANYPSNNFVGSIYHARATDDVLSNEAIAALHRDIVEKQKADIAKNAEKIAFFAEKRSAMGAMMSEKYEIFKPGQGGAKSYRIPGLFTTKDGVVIAAIDKRNQHFYDWGNIDLAIRRSLDGGFTWQDDQVVVDLAEQPYPDLGAAESALVIDAVMTQDKNTGRIIMVFDMFPESQALFGMFNNSQASFESEGNGHINVNGKWYRLITDESGARYTVREGGIIYNRDGVAQDYKVITEGDPAQAFQNLGDIIKISTDERVGNIFLRSKRAGHDSGPFNAHYTSYLWMTYSDDNGKTWANPTDITTQVKADWMRFLGTGPGTGIQLKNGNIMIPVYFTNRDNKQSAAVIISSDGGKTWTRGASPNDAYLDEIGGARYLNTQDYEITESQVIEMNNGDIKMFSRNRSGAVIISTSHDGGMTWDKGARLRESALLDPYSQMSVIHYSKLIDGKEYIVFANPHASSRRNGKAWLGEVQTDGSILWKYNTTIDEGSYSYNSLTELPNGDIGLLYEQVQGSNVQYVRFNLQELLWKDNFIYRDKRNPENQAVSLNSIEQETYYKIGDGEMIKVGEGINPAHLEVREGIATLAQQANAAGEKQAYAAVVVKEKGTLRLMDNEQLNLSNIRLEKGTFDLNGRNFTLAAKVDTENQGLRAATLNGNIINNSPTPATLTYQLNQQRAIIGTVGDQQGTLNLIYSPTESESQLSFQGNTNLDNVYVKAGTLSYTGNRHQANRLDLSPHSQVEIKNDASFTSHHIHLAENANLILNTDTAIEFSSKVEGTGNLFKTGAGYARVNGELNHEGITDIQSGIFEVNGNINKSAVNIRQNSILAGGGEIKNETTLFEEAVISPSLFITNPQTFRGNTLSFNQLNNQGGKFILTVNNNAENIKDWKHDQVLINDLNSEMDIPIDIHLLGTQQGHSDENKNGRYDADEGISLIQTKNANALQRLKIGQVLSAERSGYLYPLTLVSVESGIANADDNRISENGDSHFTDFRLQNIMIDGNGKQLEPVIRAVKQEEPKVEEATLPIVPTTPKEETPVTPKNPTLPKVETPTMPTQPASRAQIDARVPSYLVSNTALYYQGEQTKNIFWDNVHSENTKGLYAIQSYTHSHYNTDLNFVDYGYHYHTKQHTSLLGGYVAINNNTTLHSAIAYGKQTVEPKAVDGYSQAKYKTVSGLLALRHQRERIRFSLGTGYHWHRGDISAFGTKDIAKLKAHQFQLFTNLGYVIPVGQLSLIPTMGLSYQHLSTSINDQMNWRVDSKKYHIFTKQIGSYLSWQGETLRLKAGVFYEHNHTNTPQILISPTGNQGEWFNTGQLGNGMLYKASVEVAMTPNLSFGLQLNHRHALSKAKLKQTNISAKLEYKF
ncbi:exo-alpha-sialidase [Rodentibacter pneumotropicus]|uniref:exo-alpha-sialidase n=1 Tax=Rodentibacter pneumotropicus TaxID=758 RepID=UPI00036D5BF2|nr:exo-alpha-sialidase [Rodentibacter pneumotropicus]OOF61206.1 hypothetical protein BH925_02370 [Rodentibacter pneumotropicus]THA01616.1 hypothetical protein D3M72_07120 [Rodentibacter pneumotropicus]THA12237.1 hypothetical protein D3M82_10845 [Rodentibacter pneumotropicus]